MNIGIICYPTFGGSGVIATELGKALADSGHKVHFITYSQPARLDIFHENIFYHEVEFLSYPLFQYPPYELALASKIVSVVLFEKLDILHVHYAIPHASAAYTAKQILKTKKIHIPFVTTLHGTDITLVGKDPSYEPVVTFSINNSDGVTAVSQSLKEDTYKHFPIEKDILVIPNFVDHKRFKRIEKPQLKHSICPNNEYLLVHTSNFREVKRIEDVMKIFIGIRKSIPAKLILIGDGPERAKAEKIGRENHICNDVKFLGKVDHVEEILSMADLFLIPSEKESFGLAALEAMACEVPVISSNAGGLPEVNIHGKTGFISNIGDTEDMIQNALFILKKENLHSFQKNAYLQSKIFDIKKILQMYENFYINILSAPSSL